MLIIYCCKIKITFYICKMIYINIITVAFCAGLIAAAANLLFIYFKEKRK